MKSNPSKILPALLFICLIITLFAAQPASAVFDKSKGISYLRSQPFDEWSVMALSSSGSLSGTSLEMLSTDPGNKPTDIEKRILAIVAAGQNPETYPSVNLVQKLTGFFNGTEINSTASSNLLNDDIFGLLALTAAGREASIRNQIAAFIKNNQNSDGGWGFSLSPSSSDSNDTAMAIMALLANGENSNSVIINKAFDYLAKTKSATGYTFDSASGFTPDAASTAWVISAHYSAGKTPPSAAVNFLQNLQQTNGSFAWQMGDAGSALMTAYALIALNNDFYPIKSTSTNSGSSGNATLPKFQVSIVTASNTIFNGEVAFGSTSVTDSSGQVHTFQPPLAIGTVPEAAKISSFSYVIKNTSLGLFVESIAGFGPSGDKGWQYAVNGTKPNVGAASKPLNNGDKIIWFYGSPNDKPPTNTSSSNSNTNTSSTGQISRMINLTADIVGNTSGPNSSTGNTGNTNQSNNTGGGASTIVFGIDTASINFGQLGPGQVSLAKSVKLTNGGNTNLGITTQVQGSDNLYPDGIYINSLSWRIYSSNLPPNSSNNASVILFVLSNYQGTGTKTGTLTFWAKAQ